MKIIRIYNFLAIFFFNWGTLLPACTKKVATCQNNLTLNVLNTEKHSTLSYRLPLSSQLHELSLNATKCSHHTESHYLIFLPPFNMKCFTGIWERTWTSSIIRQMHWGAKSNHIIPPSVISLQAIKTFKTSYCIECTCQLDRVQILVKYVLYIHYTYNCNMTALMGGRVLQHKLRKNVL
jgi:hypothetical protein